MKLPLGHRSSRNDEARERAGIEELTGTQTEVLDSIISRTADIADTADGVDDIEVGASAKRSRSQGWGRLLQGNKAIWVVSGIAVFSLIAGLLLGQFVVSPADASANAKPPEAGLISVPVESKVLSNDVTIRGDAQYADSVEVKIETGEIGGAAVVTGQVPAVGATFDPGAIALEVTGRPVIVLPGELPVYRTLRVGVSGPDVLQLKQALNALGIGAGDLSSAVFDQGAADGVQALYDRVGYPAPASPEGTEAGVRSANEAVRSAQDNVAAAQRALSGAQAGPTQADRVTQDNLVRAAERRLAAARADQAKGTPGADVGGAEDDLNLAKITRDAELAPTDTTAESAAIGSAQQQLSTANDLLEEARNGTLTFLPASEVLYLPGLPRRVDEINVQRGSTIQGAVMKVSGATLIISGSAAESDAKLLKEGDRAVLTMPDGSEHGATISSVKPAESTDTAKSGGRYEILMTPDELSPDQLQALQGNNVRVSVPVNSTGEEVLAVPLAALTAGAGGESRIEVMTGTKDETRLIEVTTGLAAGGFVEVKPKDAPLAVGDLVVVGR